MTPSRTIFCSLALTLFVISVTRISAADDLDGVTINKWVTIGERSFTIQTSRLRARFEDGVIVSVHNRITGEDHASPIDGNDADFSTRPIPHGVEATWRGLGNGQQSFPDDVLTVRGYDFGPISNPDGEPGTPPEQRSRWPDKNVHLWQIPLGEFAGQPLLISLGTDPKGSNNADNFWWSRPILVTDDAQETRFVTLTENGEVAEEPLRVSNISE